MNTLTCPLSLFQRLLRLLAEAPNRPAFLRVGRHYTSSDREWLVRDVALSPPSPPAHRPEPAFRVALASGQPTAPPEPLPPAIIGELALGTGRWQGQWWGTVYVGATREPLHHLALVGPGMYRLSAQDPAQIPQLGRQPDDPARSRWSRTIGALGGEDIWRRLVQLRIAIIGCGRTGSLVAVTLARLGVQQLALIDPDAVETHNLGEMDAVTEADLGKPKVGAIADHLRALVSPLPMSLFPVAAPVTHPMALSLIKSCDVLFCCADNDAARLATAILATLYHKVLVDIGVGVFYSGSAAPAARGRTMGADVRLILPDDGCLLCRGNLSNYAQAVDDLCNHRLPASGQRDWRQERAGSLRTLNQMASALAVQMVQDLAAERLRSSTWAHIEFNEDGHLAVSYPPVQPPTGTTACALCAKAGLGDEGLGWPR